MVLPSLDDPVPQKGKIIELMKDKDPEIREKAIYTLLEKWRKDTDLVPVYVERIQNDDNLYVCAGAFDALNWFTKMNWEMFDFEGVASWWSKNKEKYKSS